MSIKQLQAVWELCRQGFQVTADNAARSWHDGKPFELRDRVPLGRSLESLIDQCNWEVERKTRIH
ncbi:hypothetical protein [Thiorhodococcus minor]|uniref:Uncharacterized protein n=1 Tax=Thiorhodococcus minor TaxID=57489 RepID=A0A6M0JYL6_9GAMM|nr:hypothetical protein [Thiorhodococcus minor]NEV62121.1 hypothetical protein [Thiorhodococcus minor]